MDRAESIYVAVYPLERRRFMALVSGGLLGAPFAAEAQQASPAVVTAPCEVERTIVEDAKAKAKRTLEGDETARRTTR